MAINHTSLSSLIGLALLCSVPCFCEQDQNEAVLDSRLQAGVDYTHVNLKPHGNHSFNGNLGGLLALYEYRPMNFFYGGLKFAWKEGDTHGSAGRRSLLYFDVQERAGYTFAWVKQNLVLTLFSGFGYRHIGQKLSPRDGDSVRFNYNEFYVPLGMLLDHDFKWWFALGLDVTWMPQVFSTVSIVPLKGARWNLTRTLANCFVEVPFTFTLTKNRRFQLIVNPFYEHWQDGHTTAKLSNGIPLGLPGNTYHFYGADLIFAYQF